ncbi:MAG: VWA domain-containing protein [Cyclobacteriaceae bacterium]
MALDEFLFGKISRHFRNRKIDKLRNDERVVFLERFKPKFTIIARALTGEPIDIYTAEQEGGYRDQNFFLPASISFFSTREDNFQFYLFRIFFLTIQKKLSFNWDKNDRADETLSRVNALNSSPNILSLLFNEYPVTSQFHEYYLTVLKQPDPETKQDRLHWLYGKWMRNEGIHSGDALLPAVSDKVKKIQAVIAKTTLQAKAVEEMITLDVDVHAQEEYMLTHNFEKVDTAEEFSGVWRDFDGEDELEEHQDAIDELNMKYTIRVDDAAHSILQADFVENSHISESASVETETAKYTYPEWNYSKKSYKPDFCSVYPNKIVEHDTDFYHHTIRDYRSTLQELRKMIANLSNQWQRNKRQNEGHEFDIDSLTDLYIDVHSGHTPSENIYVANRKTEKELSILLLLDISLSSDSYAAGNKVLDVEKQVATLFGEILAEMNIDFSIHCFYSKTRNFSTYTTLKDFDDSWTKAKFRIGKAEASGYTRIGAALRHSGTLLKERDPDKKWIILLSDGKPNDFDRYEGKYGINDIKQALRELHAQQINTFALAIEATARYYLPQMFGQNNYKILTNPKALISSLIGLLTRIRFGA